MWHQMNILVMFLLFCILVCTPCFHKIHAGYDSINRRGQMGLNYSYIHGNRGQNKDLRLPGSSSPHVTIEMGRHLKVKYLISAKSYTCSIIKE